MSNDVKTNMLSALPWIKKQIYMSLSEGLDDLK